jgi:type I restriction enzyme S subunit
MSELLEKKELIPKLRFPEFASLEAPVVQLRRLAGLVTESALLSQINPASYVSTESLLPEFGGFDRPGGLPTVSSVRAYRQNGVLVSNIRPYLKKVWYADRDGGASNDVLVFRANRETKPSYLAQLIRNDRFINHLMKFAKGVKMPRGDGDDALSFMVFSATEAEQRKIAGCLESLDDLIAAETGKLETLNRHKKGLLQQLFPAEGEISPRLRFPQFRNSGEWTEHKLGDVCTLISGQHLEPHQYANVGRLPYFSGPADLTNDINRALKWVNASRNTGKAKDILVTVKGSGAGGVWLSSLDEVALGRQLMALRATGCNSEFVYQYLLTRIRRLEAMAAGNLIPGLSRPNLLTLALPLPLSEEQKVIADVLSAADNEIEQLTHRIDLLMLHKAALMQQLFPALDEIEA